jgi:hypothetical protein
VRIYAVCEFQRHQCLPPSVIQYLRRGRGPLISRVHTVRAHIVCIGVLSAGSSLSASSSRFPTNHGLIRQRPRCGHDGMQLGSPVSNQFSTPHHRWLGLAPSNLIPTELSRVNQRQPAGEVVTQYAQTKSASFAHLAVHTGTTFPLQETRRVPEMYCTSDCGCKIDGDIGPYGIEVR